MPILIPCPRCSGTCTLTHEDRHTETRQDVCPGRVPAGTGETRAASFDPAVGLAPENGAPAAGAAVRFASGDPVPGWVVHVLGGRLFFRVPCTAARGSDGRVTVTGPLVVGGFLRFEHEPGAAIVVIMGAPTHWELHAGSAERADAFECGGEVQVREIRVHPVAGEFVVAEGGTWLPGSYATRAGARRAAERFTYEALRALQDRKNAEAGGSGGTITDADLDALTAEATATSS